MTTPKPSITGIFSSAARADIWPTHYIAIRRVVPGLWRWDCIDREDWWHRHGYHLTHRAAYRAARRSMVEAPPLWTRPAVLTTALGASLAIWALLIAAIVAAS